MTDRPQPPGTGNTPALYQSGSPPSRPLGRLAVAHLVGAWSRFVGRCPGDGFGILTYHRIACSDGAPTWNVAPDRFRAQLSGLLGRGYEPWPLTKVLADVAAGRPIARRAFVVTFDDGYENVYTRTWPVLQELGIPATVFLATAYLDSPAPFPFDDWPAANHGLAPDEAWRPLTTAQCREMQDGGLVELGSHTHTHANFRGRPDDLAADVSASLAVLRDRFGVGEPTFSFPFGIFAADLDAVIRQSGVRCALSTQADLVRPGNDPFAWGRFGVDDADTTASLAARLDGWYSLARRVWLTCIKPILRPGRRCESALPRATQ